MNKNEDEGSTHIPEPKGLVVYIPEFGSWWKLSDEGASLLQAAAQAVNGLPNATPAEGDWCEVTEVYENQLKVLVKLFGHVWLQITPIV